MNVAFFYVWVVFAVHVNTNCCKLGSFLSCLFLCTWGDFSSCYNTNQYEEGVHEIFNLFSDLLRVPVIQLCPILLKQYVPGKKIVLPFLLAKMMNLDSLSALQLPFMTFQVKLATEINPVQLFFPIKLPQSEYIIYFCGFSRTILEYALERSLRTPFLWNSHF